MAVRGLPSFAADTGHRLPKIQTKTFTLEKQFASRALTGARKQRERNHENDITLNGGSLGLWVDEERSKKRVDV
jgi:hypothetical protein